MTGDVARAGFISRRELIESFATPSFGPVLADDTSKQMTSLLLEFSERAANPADLQVTEQPVRVRVVSSTTTTASVDVWSVLVVAVPTGATARAMWRTVTLDLVLIGNRWLVDGLEVRARAMPMILVPSRRSRPPPMSPRGAPLDSGRRGGGVMWPFPNPLDLFGDAIGGAVGWAWDKVIQGIYTWFVSGVLMLMEWVWSVLDSATTPRLTEDWFASGLVQPLAAISLVDHRGDDARIGRAGWLRWPT